MKIKTSELIGPALDWAVAIAEGFKPHQLYYARGSKSLFTRVFDEDGNPNGYMTGSDRLYSQKWEAGGPIIEREGILIIFCNGDLGESRNYWIAKIGSQSWGYGYGPYHEQKDTRSLEIYDDNLFKGETPLVAAMRCYVASKLGQEVEIPDCLVNFKG